MEITTHKLEYYVPESESTLRVLPRRKRKRYRAPEEMEKKRRRWGGGGRARRSMSYYAGNISAEIATVLRNNANILIRLRGKMKWHLCTVYYSTRNPIILIRCATKTQNAARTQEESTIEFYTSPTLRTIQNAIEIRGSAHIV